MYIGYDKKNGYEYAKICKSERIDGKVKTTQIPLGRVIDKEAGIYKSRARGIFTYDLATNTYGTPDPSAMKEITRRTGRKEKLILDFGDSLFLSCYLTRIGMDPVIDALEYENQDSVRALLLFYILRNMENCNAREWYDGSYARILYPKANLESRCINDLLASIGSESSYQAFFEAYSALLTHREPDNKDIAAILIDSTGLPCSVHFPLTAICSRDGQLRNEARLVYAVQQGTGLPLYIRCVPDNVIDVSPLEELIPELHALGISAKFSILDAGYLTERNTAELYAGGIPFVSKLQEDCSLYRELLESSLPALMEAENFVSYHGRYAYILRVECELFAAHKAYAYIVLDPVTQSFESEKLLNKAARENLRKQEIHNMLRTQGIFILVSSESVAREEILPLYCTGRQIEQVFDLRGHSPDLLPIQVQSEEAFRGHLLLTFTASVIYSMLQADLKDTAYTPESALLILGNQKCKVCDGYVIMQDAGKKQKEIYKRFHIKVADTFAIN